MEKVWVSGYEGTVYSANGGYYFAEVPIMSILVKGTTKKEALTNLEKSVQDWLVQAKEKGLTIPLPKAKEEYKIKHAVTPSGKLYENPDMTLTAVRGILIHQKDLKGILGKDEDKYYELTESELNMVYVDNSMEDGHVVLGQKLMETKKSILSEDMLSLYTVDDNRIRETLRKYGFTDKQMHLLDIKTYYVSYYSY